MCSRRARLIYALFPFQKWILPSVVSRLYDFSAKTLLILNTSSHLSLQLPSFWPSSSRATEVPIQYRAPIAFTPRALLSGSVRPSNIRLTYTNKQTKSFAKSTYTGPVSLLLIPSLRLASTTSNGHSSFHPFHDSMCHPYQFERTLIRSYLFEFPKFESAGVTITLE